MIDPNSRSDESRQKERKGWNQTEGGVFSVLLGLVGLFLYFLVTSLLLIALLSGILHPGDVEGMGVAVSLILGVIQLGSFVLLVMGRIRCVACPHDIGGPLFTSTLGPLVSLAAGAAGTFLLFEPIFGPVWNGKATALSFAVSLLALFIGEFGYLIFLDRLSLFVDSASLRQHVEHFLPGSAVVALLIGMTTFGVMVAFSPENRSSNSAAQFTSAVTMGTLILSLGLLVLIGWYCKVAFEAWHAVQVYREKCDAVCNMGLVWAEGEPAARDSPPPVVQKGQEDDFERYFLEEAGQQGESTPPS